jgi:hypothetical protein
MDEGIRLRSISGKGVVPFTFRTEEGVEPL